MNKKKAAEDFKRAKIDNRFAAQEKALSFKQTLKRIFKTLKSERWLFAVIVLISIISTLLSATIPYLIGRFVGYLSNLVQEYGAASTVNADITIDYYFLKLLAAVYVINTMLIYSERYLLANFSARSLKQFRQLLFEKLKKLPLLHFENQAHGDTLSRFSNDIESIGSMISESFIFTIMLVLRILTSSIMMFYLSPLLAVAIFTLVPVIYIISDIISKRARPLYKEQAKILGRRYAMIEESFAAIDVIRDYNQIENINEKYSELNEEYRKVAIKAQITVGYLMPLLNVITNFSLVIIAFLGGYLALRFGLGIGVIVSFIAYSRQFIRPVNQIASTYSSLQSALASAERVFEFLDLPEEENNGRLDFASIDDLEIEIKNLSFSYDEHKRVLNNINMHIPARKKIAFIGETGAGKTSLAALISRFYAFENGRITIGGIDIKEFERNSFYEHFALVLQDSYLFAGTIADNIRYGKLGASDEAVVEAAKKASCHGFICKLPLGYQTILTNGGTNISQGERQLLTIARAILADPKILILDEATSNVDTQTESQIQKAMLNLMKDRTSIIIAHRLSTVKDADCIYVFENGEIIESGSHQQLKAEKGKYYRLLTANY